MSKLPWGSIDVHLRERVLTGRKRLAALVLFLRREPPKGATFVDAVTGEFVTDPIDITWSQFPLQEAIDGIPATWDEA